LHSLEKMRLRGPGETHRGLRRPLDMLTRQLELRPAVRTDPPTPVGGESEEEITVVAHFSSLASARAESHREPPTRSQFGSRPVSAANE
jgi:hypothetical protein